MFKALKYLLVGFLFGIVLTKSEAVSWYRIYEMFHFQSFHMFGIIGTALFTGIVIYCEKTSRKVSDFMRWPSPHKKAKEKCPSNRIL